MVGRKRGPTLEEIDIVSHLEPLGLDNGAMDRTAESGSMLCWGVFQRIVRKINC